MAEAARKVRGKQVSEFPSRRELGYDFSPVADGKVYLLRKGQDFDVRVESMRTSVYKWAKRNGKRVATAVAFDRPPGDRKRAKVGLYVQFTDRRRRP